MCGITGFWNNGAPEAALAGRMARRIETRGPDDAGVWTDEPAGLALAHRRLSILDLSLAGHQPMQSPCGRYVIVYNGEIYNHQDLRQELEVNGGAFEWRGHSDTETLLAALRYWGIEKTLERVNGMFAFALWDATERTLFLARDRVGIKPLYYGRSGDTFLFGSELKALTVHPDWQGEVSRDALALYMRHNYVPAPWSIYKGINKLRPGHFVVITNNGHDIGNPACYWDLAQIAEQGIESSYGESEVMIDELDALLRDAIGRRMVADVPLGAFLSGGYDSTAVAALMQAESDRSVKTFSIGFEEESHNEAKYARAVAEHLNTDHTELYVTSEMAMGVIPELSQIWDEPFSDSSQIPTYLVSKLAREHVTVSLSGDGGDEQFFGYDRYLKGMRIWNKLRSVPLPLRKTLAPVMKRIPAAAFGNLPFPESMKRKVALLGDRLPKIAEILDHGTQLDFYLALMSHWKAPENVVLGASEPKSVFTSKGSLSDKAGFTEIMMFLDTLNYLPDDILTKVDRASMAVSLEARVPLLDHRVTEFSWRVPFTLKYRDGKGKWLLRELVHRYVPREMMERPKMGFGVPIEDWLRGPLRDWGESLLNERRLREEGFFDSSPIRKMWDEHVSGKRRWHYYLWDVLMFQAWLTNERD